MVLNERECFCLLVIFCWNEFSHKKNQQYASCLLLKLPKPHPLQVQHDLNCSQNRIGDGDGYEESKQYKNQGGVCCKVQGWRVGEDNKEWKKPEDEDRGGGICP